MSVIDESKMKLLKMKERLLSLGSDNLSAIDEYKKTACEIDMELYTSITDNINANKDYINYSLEKQLEFLMGLEEDFNRYYIFQRNILMNCSRYSIEGIDLTNSSLIRIEEISERIRNIKKYLENEQEIEKNNLELERLNEELIDEDKKTYMFQERVALLDAELRKNTLQAEGRKLKQNGDIEYVSVLTEAEGLGIDIKTAFEDSHIINEKIAEVEDLLEDAKERLRSAQICYENDSNDEYKELYQNIRKETVDIRYRLMFLKIIQLIGSYESTYEGANRKRTELNELIKTRVSLLEQLGVKYLYDPFDRIGINNQLEIVRAYGNNQKKYDKSKLKIEEIISDNDERINQNKNFSDYFKVNVELLSTVEETAHYDEDIDVSDENNYAYNEVINVGSIPSDFKLDRAHEKTYEVIKRVCSIMAPSDEPDVTYDVNPSLVIEADTDNLDIDNTKDELFIDETPFEEITDNTSSKEMDNESIFEDAKPFDDEQTVSTTADLFQEVDPFNEPQLFDDRYDDGTVFVDNVEATTTSLESDNLDQVAQVPTDTTTTTQTPEMPDVFWETSKEPVGEGEVKSISFDEQIAALMNDDAKTKKLVS